jgi:hypothetical protein
MSILTTPVSALSPLANVVPRPLDEREQQTITLPTDPWSAQRAYSIARGDFEMAERYRMSSGHDMRFRNSDELYLGWVQQRMWEGTRMPRSSIGVPIAMDQVEALMPSIISNIFPLRDNVEVRPQPGTTSDEAQAVYDLLMAQLDDLDPESMVSSREEIRKAVKQGLVYGNGVLELTWMYKKVMRKRLVSKFIPVTKTLPDPFTGQPATVMTGQARRLLAEVTYPEELNYPELRHRDIRDCYWDPNLSSPNFQLGRFFAVRHLMPIGEIKLLRSQVDRDSNPMFDIPDDARLTEMAKGRTGVYTENLKNTPDTYRNIMSPAAVDYVENPDAKRLEVIRYYNKDRLVWLFNREWVAYNKANPVGFLPFLGVFYVDVPNRSYAMSVPDVTEGEQRLQQGIINSRIDELALILHPPFAKKRGTSIMQSSLRMTPGKVIEMENPRDDLIKVEFPGITNNAYVEVEASDRRAQKHTGVTDLAVLGTPGIGGNSANRTATGISTQSQASGARIQYIVDNLDSTLIEPLLNMVLRMNQQFLSPIQTFMILGPEGKAIEIDPMRIMNASIKFVVRSGQKMKSRAALLQGLPLISQTLLNPQFVSLLSQQQNLVPDMKAITRDIADAFRLNYNAWFRDATAIEQNQVMMARMGPEFLKMQAQQQRLQSKSADIDATNETALIKHVAGKIITPETAHQILASMNDLNAAEQSGAPAGQAAPGAAPAAGSPAEPGG